jgi:hypothetical protein
LNETDGRWLHSSLAGLCRGTVAFAVEPKNMMAQMAMKKLGAT